MITLKEKQKMIKRKTSLRIRKAHRYLGLFLGVQFVLWTVSGLYFSWTNIDEIHGDQFKQLSFKPKNFSNLMSPSLLGVKNIHTVELREISGIPYYWINNRRLYNAFNGEPKDSITPNEAIDIVSGRMLAGLNVESVDFISSTDKHHEYRNKMLPAYVISFESEDNLKAYVSSLDGNFQTVRHRNWRWFDFLWMTHTMDYEGRDDFNNTLLRVFSLLGLITVFSGFLLWFTTSPKIRKLFKSLKNP